MLLSLRQKSGFLYRRTLILLGLIMLTGIIFPEVAFSQTGGMKISSLSDIESKASEAATSSKNIVSYIFPVVFFLSLVFVVWAIARNDPHKEQYAIGWFISLVIYLIALAIV